MSNLTAVIVGATGGIGKAIVENLCKNNVNVVLVARNAEALQSMQTELKRQFPQLQLQSLCCDLSDAESREQFIQALSQQNIRINYYINNAGVNDFSLFSHQSGEAIEQMMLINVVYPLQLIQQIIPLMSKTAPSQIINMGSTFGSIGYPGYVSYCASKFALRGATEALAREYSNSTIQFKYFSPRATDTAMNSPVVVEMNAKLGVKMDSPAFVAEELYQFMQNDKLYYQVGYPEKIFVKVNQVLPNVVSNSIQKDIDKIQRFAELNHPKITTVA
ncbi:SDR family oxidoreductase [Acinetobacter sp.]|uniref:SDR family oxidoreductase n=1 Tax=Acinetobacter sp. TaxID=472 RepID=UPI0035AEB238